jgi:nucleotide-binding universal stress UspA family protein
MAERATYPRPESLVLVALDGSPVAATALPVARAIAAQLGARVEALHVMPPGTHAVDVRAILGSAGESTDRIRLHTVNGTPAEEILRAGEDPNVVLVVLATHGHTVRPNGVLAAIPRRVIAETTRPVLMVRPEAVDPSAPAQPVRRLLVPVDGTPTTTEAYAPATEIAARLRAEIDVLFVVHPGQEPPAEHGSMVPPYYVDQPQYEWPAWEARVATWVLCHCQNLPKETMIHAYVASGRTRDEIGAVIAKFAAEHRADAVVLLRRSHLEASRAPILRAVFDRTPCPVLLVAGPTREQPPDQVSTPAGLTAATAHGQPVRRRAART